MQHEYMYAINSYVFNGESKNLLLINGKYMNKIYVSEDANEKER